MPKKNWDVHPFIMQTTNFSLKLNKAGEYDDDDDD